MPLFLELLYTPIRRQHLLPFSIKTLLFGLILQQLLRQLDRRVEIWVLFEFGHANVRSLDNVFQLFDP